MSRRMRALGLLVAAVVGLPAAAAAQAASAIGLGYPVLPIDGRSAALGSTGLGLLGSSFSLLNPADLRQHENPGFGLAFAAEGVDIEGPDEPLSSGRHRFNLIRAVAPFGEWAVGIAFGGAFDQDWAVRFQDTLVLFDGTVPFEETREHDGGISTIDISAAREVGPISIGFSAQRLSGSLRQTFSRSFDPPTGDAPSLGATGGTQTLAYSGWRFRGGAFLELGDRALLSGAVALGSTLKATPDGDEEALGEVDLPATFNIGASGRLLPDLMLAASVGWGAWSSVGDLGEAKSYDIVQYGGGVEYDAIRLLGGDLPIRFGARRFELPFSNGDRPITERAVTGGFGWIFRNGVAEVNVALDFGSRGDFAQDELEESFRRLTVSFALRQIGPF
ncbi:MAG: hypothetical protein R3195_12440 [Gemmatimonadota bacterium]|nr:hypothetical protein [Gemmatimonadota bacterium]